MVNSGVHTQKLEKTSNKKGDIDHWKKDEVLHDYYLAFVSREMSIMARKEVLNGRAKFGIFGDGKELGQIAFAKFFKEGDWRSGYYRDQTFMLAAGLLNIEEFFCQLYGDTDLKVNPSSGGRSFNNHFATRSLNEDGSWIDLTKQKNSAADLSPTAGQMPRLLGLGLASKLARQQNDSVKLSGISVDGNEVAFGMIGDASTSEGHFFEVLNAAAVLQVPIALSVWDDGYGISVPREKQTVHSSIYEALQGFSFKGNGSGILLYQGKGWDYPGLVNLYKEGINICRKEHIPIVFHIDEINQPLGHSTSGSHERYKSSERLEWERQFDGIRKMKEWILQMKLASEEELKKIESRAIEEVRQAKQKIWKKYTSPFLHDKQELLNIVRNRGCKCTQKLNDDRIEDYVREIEEMKFPIRKDIVSIAKRIIRYVCNECTVNGGLKQDLKNWLLHSYIDNIDKYSDRVYNENHTSVMNVHGIMPQYSDQSEILSGREILRKNFDQLLERYPLLVIFGEDVGKIGGVNQCLEGLQQKYGEHRVFDTGIRETSIIGKGIGLALRGFRPIAEIQYFDYLLYTLQTLSDDLATTHWRTRGGQVVPLIIRTRGHRLEGIWHSGSPMSMVINSIRGIYVCVPRNMTQAAGFYNTLLQGEDPALVIEPLNGYRLKEVKPDNLKNMAIPLGVPEKLTEGNDLTLVTYGSCVRIADEAINQLKDFNIQVELIDVQTLLPFDIHHSIAESVKKTGKVLFFDEDVPGGAAAYMMQKVLEEQSVFSYLTVPARTLTAREHRPAYNSDGDYFSKPNAENVFEVVYEMMHQSNPREFPSIY